jgi:hypothetical protein
MLLAMTDPVLSAIIVALAKSADAGGRFGRIVDYPVVGLPISTDLFSLAARGKLNAQNRWPYGAMTCFAGGATISSSSALMASTKGSALFLLLFPQRERVESAPGSSGLLRSVSSPSGSPQAAIKT